MAGECLQTAFLGDLSIPVFAPNESSGFDIRQPSPNEHEVTYSSGFETKYLLTRSTDRKKLVHWLSSLCQPDCKFPRANVHSIYFDTRDWKLLGDKLDSNFIKLKVRLRWYSNPENGNCDRAVFLEIKRRVGSQREKRRLLFPLPAHELIQRGCDSEVERLVHALLPILGFTLPRGLFGAFQVRYHRYRFLDPTTCSRISVDSEIVAPAVYRSRASRIFKPPMDRVVLEVKGSSVDLPVNLRRLARIGIRKSSFSKFANCANHILHLKNQA